MKAFVFRMICFLEWLKTFLTNRTMAVKIRNCVSSNILIVSGVPQERVLGSYLVLLHLDEIIYIAAGLDVWSSVNAVERGGLIKCSKYRSPMIHRTCTSIVRQIVPSCSLDRLLLARWSKLSSLELSLKSSMLKWNFDLSGLERKSGCIAWKVKLQGVREVRTWGVSAWSVNRLWSSSLVGTGIEVCHKAVDVSLMGQTVDTIAPMQLYSASHKHEERWMFISLRVHQ